MQGPPPAGTPVRLVDHELSGALGVVGVRSSGRRTSEPGVLVHVRAPPGAAAAHPDGGWVHAAQCVVVGSPDWSLLRADEVGPLREVDSAAAGAGAGAEGDARFTQLFGTDLATLRRCTAVGEAQTIAGASHRKNQCLHGAPRPQESRVVACTEFINAMEDVVDDANALRRAARQWVITRGRGGQDATIAILRSMAADGVLDADFTTARCYTRCAIALHAACNAGDGAGGSEGGSAADAEVTALITDETATEWHVRRYLARSCSCTCILGIRPTTACALSSCGALHAPPEVTLRKCSKCNLTHYCCAEHQREDWKTHKKLCAPKTPK
jgi:hypothetical protein